MNLGSFLSAAFCVHERRLLRSLAVSRVNISVLQSLQHLSESWHHLQIFLHVANTFRRDQWRSEHYERLHFYSGVWVRIRLFVDLLCVRHCLIWQAARQQGFILTRVLQRFPTNRLERTHWIVSWSFVVLTESRVCLEWSMDLWVEQQIQNDGSVYRFLFPCFLTLLTNSTKRQFKAFIF